MQVEHHILHEEFPEHRAAIQALQASHDQFARLCDEYHLVTQEVERLEEADVPVGDLTFEDMKKKRVKLKDELYRLLVGYQSGKPLS
ncbi:YdcH family protein [Azospira restricta]|uniref:YdcH family protein n=1 Tax=Azospira restricta TaxID=404405 RepID=A0A974SMV1_9RHOO|nr:YdcH family protein [Azospira restricta]QRJ63386.1 YdcH family protein [Azospira restricta]